jgi:D-cysteine desulfhydrase family pyridoxal phosphate-dependent enzyme
MFIGKQPRLHLAALPTPLMEACRLREALGGKTRCPRIFIKRDDLTGLAFGGNKARKLEFLVGDALRRGARVLVTSGAVQSNHARMTAAAGCVAGLRTSLVLTSDEEPPVVQGNLLLDYLLGAEVHFLAGRDPMKTTNDREGERLDEIVRDLSARGDAPYLIPMGGSSPVGTFGYVLGTLELVTQLSRIGQSPTRLYYASGSRGTQAGLSLGARMYSAPYQPVGIAVSGGEPEKSQKALRIANEAAELLGAATRLTLDELLTDNSYIGPGYGVATPGSVEAIRLLAQYEGIFLDPVYTGKAMAGLIDHIRRRRIDPSDTVVFLHTGGTPGLFAYTRDLVT